MSVVEHDPADVMANNIMAAGGLWMALLQADVEAEPVTVDGVVTNQIDVRLSFLKSAYRLTVELVPDTEVEQPEQVP